MKHDPIRTKKLARDTFESWSAHYDRSLLNHFLFRPSYYVFMEELARLQAAVMRPLNVLDIGCGTGTLARMVAESNLQVERFIGLDYASGMCAQAGAKLSHTSRVQQYAFINADSEHLPFARRTFDVITCANSFHHYPHQRVALREMHRVLRPGGTLMIIDGFRDNIVGWVVFDVIITRIEKAVYHVPWSTMRSYFLAAGFNNVRQRKFNFLFPALLTAGTS